MDASGDIVAESAKVRELVEQLIAEKGSELANEKDKYEDRLEAVDNQLTGLEARLAELNGQVGCMTPNMRSQIADTITDY